MPKPNIEVSIWIARSTEDIWNYLCDVSNEVLWRYGVYFADWITDPPIGVGSIGYHFVKSMGDYPWQIVVWEEPKHMSWDVIDGRFKGAYAGYRKYAPYLMLLPFLLFFIVFKIGPIFWAVVYSFIKWDGITVPRFFGLRNYMYLFSWDRFWTALLNTLYFVVVFNLIMLFLALTIAVTLSSEGVRWKKLFRTNSGIRQPAT